MKFHWMMLAAAITTSMAGQTLLKAGASVPNFIAQLFDPRTLAGFVLMRLGHIPKDGESVNYEGRTLTVVEMEGRRISKIRVEPAAKQ